MPSHQSPVAEVLACATGSTSTKVRVLVASSTGTIARHRGLKQVGLANRPVDSVKVHELCYLCWENHSLRALSAGAFVSVAFARSVREGSWQPVCCGCVALNTWTSRVPHSTGDSKSTETIRPTRTARTMQLRSWLQKR